MSESKSSPFYVSPFLTATAKLLFRLAGWKTEGGLPAQRKFVVIAAPHTSNWDGILMVVAAQIFRMKIAWYVKKEAFFFPLGILIRAFGGVPIDRSKRTNMVGAAIEQFNERQEFILAVPPEGTRKHSPYWKTGFYHIAHGAGVPTVLGYLDYGRKIAGLGPAFVTTGDINADFAVFREFYSKVSPRFEKDRGDVVPNPGK